MISLNNMVVDGFRVQGSGFKFEVWGLNDASGHRPITIYGEAATFIPNSSFLIPNYLLPLSALPASPTTRWIS